MIHAANPHSRLAVIFTYLILKFWDGRTDGRTICVKIVITAGRDRDYGRPRGSIYEMHEKAISTSKMRFSFMMYECVKAIIILCIILAHSTDF